MEKNSRKGCEPMILDAKWIACGKECETPLIAKEFFLDDPREGVIEITGLGYFELYLNGRRVSDDCLVPALSDYQDRDLTKAAYPIHDKVSHRVYYLRYDVTGFLRPGENRMEVLLGNGWYRQLERYGEGRLEFSCDGLLARFAMEVRCGNGETVTVRSDGSETYTPTFITYNNLYIGEIQDARERRLPKEPRAVELVPGPNAPLMLQTCPPDRKIREITPKLIGFNGSRRIYDAGENISGWVRVRSCQPEGAAVTLRFAEILDEAGELDFGTIGCEYVGLSGRHQIQTDVFIGDGSDCTFEPRFTFHTFRYFEVEGETRELTVVVVHSDVAVTSDFFSGNPGLNWLYEAFIRTQLDNMHGGVPSDCPHRERLGYTGDGQVACEPAMMLLDSRSFYEKWIGDILDCQDPVSGHVQHTTPFMGGGGGPGGWGSAVVIVPYRYYRNFGDWNMLERCYPAMKKWVGYMNAHSEKGLVTSEEPGGWCLGDWAAIDPMAIPEPYVNTCYLVRSLEMMVEIAEVLGLPHEAEDLREEISRKKAAIRGAYYDSETGSFCGGVQGADAFALDIGLDEDPRTLENLCKKYEALGCFDTGFLGTDLLVEVLFRYGKEDLAFRLLSTEKRGGYLWMRDHGATTIWEYFVGKRSQCHPMFGAPVQYLFSEILGIRQEKGSVRYDRVEIAPRIPAGLDHACGRITTPHGEIVVDWCKEGGKVRLAVTVPESLRAVLRFQGQETVLAAGSSVVEG